jgi:hypothetical protein
VPEAARKPPFPLIHEALVAGRVIPFIGSGASPAVRDEESKWQKGMPDFLPTPRDLARHLADKATFPEEDAVDLTTVAQYYDVVAGRRVLEDELHDIFDIECDPGPLHKLLARRETPLLIVTTNYDDLIERAFRDRGRPYDLVIHQTDAAEWGGAVIHWPYGATEPRFSSPKSLRIDLSRTTVIYKMHGGVDGMDAARDSFVIDEDDYTDFLVRVADKTAIPAIFAEAVSIRSFLFLGYSLRDWNFRMILSKIDRDLPHSPQARRSGARQERGESWAIQKDTSALERKLWEARNVNIFELDIAEFVARLRQAQGGAVPGEVR